MISLILIAVLAVASAALFVLMLHWKRSFINLSRMMSSQRSVSFKAIDSSMGIFLSLLQVGALHGTGGEPMRREMKRLLMTNPEEEDTLLSDICTLADYRYYGIISYLKEMYPDLNGNDLKLCALLCFKPGAAGLMSLYNHNNTACYYNKRWRVMRRMHLPKGETTLEKFLFETIDSLKVKERE